MKNKTRRIKGFPITIKWALATSAFLFVVMTAFFLLAYRSANNLVILEERQKVERAIKKVQKCLGKSDVYLTRDGVRKMLSNSGLLVEEKSNIGDSEVTTKVSRFVSVIEQPSIIVNLYNQKKDIVYMSEKNKFTNWEKTEQIPSLFSIDRYEKLVMTSKIISNKTHKVIGYIQVYDELSSFYDIRRDLRRNLIMLDVIAFFMSIALSYFLSVYFLKPIHLLRDTMQMISEDPQSEQEMKYIHTKDELEDLSRIFNRMLRRMRSYAKQQEQFVADVSHELRTPVAVIQGQLSMLTRWGKDDPEVLDEALRASLQEIDRMKSLVEEMLELARVGQLDGCHSGDVTKIKQVLQHILRNFRLLHPDFELSLLDDRLKEETKALIFRNHLEQIITIVFDNAIKYSADIKKVDVIAEETREFVQVSIRDYGEGIAQEDIGKIFNRFYRVDKARARKKGGNGLGLSIAYQLMENYEGEILVESEIGQGAVFKLRFLKVR